MFYLVDGYNLLHAMGLMLGRQTSSALKHARARFLELLRLALRGTTSDVTVIFDASHAPPNFDAEQEYQNIHVRFAVHFEEADDLIEELIRKASVPARLTVVSDDHRIQVAARRRCCGVLGCVEFLDALDAQRRMRADPSTEPVKPHDFDAAYWAHEFRDVADLPGFKQLFQPFDFEDESKSD